MGVVIDTLTFCDPTDQFPDHDLAKTLGLLKAVMDDDLSVKLAEILAMTTSPEAGIQELFEEYMEENSWTS